MFIVALVIVAMIGRVVVAASSMVFALYNLRY